MRPTSQRGGPMVWRRLRTPWLCLWLAACPLLLRGADDAWLVKKWDLEDGIPALAITGLAQGADGFMWVATRATLTRFDGLRFQDFPSSEFLGGPLRGFRLMAQDRAGGLWLAADPNVVVHLGAGPAETFTMPVSLAPMAIQPDAEGAVWVTYGQGTVCRIAAGRVETVSTGQGLPPGDEPLALTCDRAGTLWFAKAGALGVRRDGRFVTLQRVGSGSASLAPARAGGVWAWIDGQLYRHDGRTLSPSDEAWPVSGSGNVATMLEDRTGALWIGTSPDGLLRYDGRRVEAIASSDRNITALAEDNEGNIWVGTSGGGLERVQPRALELEGTAQGLPPDMVQSLAEDVRGTIWAATRNGMLVRRLGERWETVIGPGHPYAESVICVAGGSRGEVWIGTRRNALLRWQDGELRTWGAAQGMQGRAVHALLPVRDGGVWIAVEGPDALYRLEGDSLQSVPVPAGMRRLRPMAEDQAGDIWIRAERALLRIHGPEAVDETPRIRTVEKLMRSLAVTPDGAVWIGYGGGGLARLKGEDFDVVTTEQGLLDDRVSQLVADGLGWFWVGSDRGIFKVAQGELEAVMAGKASRVRSTYYARNVGLPSQPAIFGESPGALRSRDGKVWIPLRSGIAVVDPLRLPQDVAAPAVRVTEVVVDGRPVAAYRTPWAARRGLELLDREATVDLAPGYRRLDVSFTAPSFRSPENVQFRYKLEGLEDDWVDAGRQRSASYSRLAPGTYRFRVSASNSDGVWNETGASVTLAVAPFMWQTWWFRAAAAIAFTLLVVAAVRYVSYRRLRARLKALEQQVALDRERTRIARDIHDDLGGSLTQIALLSDRALHERAASDPASGYVETISTRVREGIRSLDEIVWAINPSNDTLEHLLDYIGQYAVDFLRLAGIRCQVDLPVTLPERGVSAEARHSLFLAVKETLNNVVRHAGATEVKIHGTVAAGSVELVIADNGRGFAQPPRDAHANGLRNLRQRMAEAGGSYEVRSAPGEGTTVFLGLPHAAAPTRTNVR